jgi:hypothetical protein
MAAGNAHAAYGSIDSWKDLPQPAQATAVAPTALGFSYLSQAAHEVITPTYTIPTGPSLSNGQVRRRQQASIVKSKSEAISLLTRAMASAEPGKLRLAVEGAASVGISGPQVASLLAGKAISAISTWQWQNTHGWFQRHHREKS